MVNTAVLDGLLYKGYFLWSADTKEHEERVVYSSCKQHKQIMEHNGVVNMQKDSSLALVS